MLLNFYLIWTGDVCVLLSLWGATSSGRCLDYSIYYSSELKCQGYHIFSIIYDVYVFHLPINQSILPINLLHIFFNWTLTLPLRLLYTFCHVFSALLGWFRFSWRYRSLEPLHWRRDWKEIPFDTGSCWQDNRTPQSKRLHR